MPPRKRPGDRRKKTRPVGVFSTSSKGRKKPLYRRRNPAPGLGEQVTTSTRVGFKERRRGEINQRSGKDRRTQEIAPKGNYRPGRVALPTEVFEQMESPPKVEEIRERQEGGEKVKSYVIRNRRKRGRRWVVDGKPNKGRRKTDE